jgi:hypothetical protein
MQVVDSLDGPRFDSRGLPEGFDPHKLYEYRYATLVKDSTGFESFLYKYIPYSLIRSFAFAIDPTAAFKVSPYTITLANRTKWRGTASVLLDRFYTQSRNADFFAQAPNYRGVSDCWAPTATHTPANNPPFTIPLGKQDPLLDYLKDTTSRTRLIGSEQGTLEYFKGYLNSPPRTVTKGAEDRTVYPSDVNPSYCVVVGGTRNNTSGAYDYQSQNIHPTSARLSSSVHTALRISEIAFNKALAQKNAISLLKDWSPYRRDYSLFRNLAELRDIPSSVLSLKETLKNLRSLYVSLSTSPSVRKIIFDLKKTSKDIPNEYLSYHFGWKQTYKDLMDLLVAPSKISKKYDFLIKRNGQPTTFRTSRKYETAEKGVSGFQYDVSGFEYEFTQDSRIERESELRLVINATFDFPPINTPHFRLNDYLDRIGIAPRVTDVYNLIPWTWLVDWFTGFGNYVELIDNINHDPGLINWGMITCHTNGKLITAMKSKSNTVRSLTTWPNSTVFTTEVRGNNHESQFVYECQTRGDVATVLDVKLTSVPSSLTVYQKSIIGALLAQRIEYSRTNSFRVRS